MTVPASPLALRPPRERRSAGPPIPWLLYAAVGISATGGLMFGYDMGVISGAVLFVARDFGLSSVREEVVVSAALAGAVLGTGAGGHLADLLGRRTILLLLASLYALAAAGTALSPSPPWIIMGRVVMGAAVGAVSFIAPLYISEVSPLGIRGRMVSINQVALASGIIISYLADYALSAGGLWRWMIGLAAVPAVLLAGGMTRMPESPRWLAGRSRTAEARAALARLRGTGDVGEEIRAIREGLFARGSAAPGILGPGLRRPLMIGVGLAVFQQVTGINTVIYYAPTIFQFTGVATASSAILATVGVGAVNVTLTLVAMALLDRAGRRPLLLTGLAGMVLSLAALGGAFALPSLSGPLPWITLGGLMVYVGSFAVGLGPVFWLLISEIYPLTVRGRAMALATVTNWGANLLVALTFLSLIRTLGRPGVLWLYSGVGLAAWMFSYLFVPETKGRSLEDIERLWRPPRIPGTGGPGGGSGREIWHSGR